MQIAVLSFQFSGSIQTIFSSFHTSWPNLFKWSFAFACHSHSQCGKVKEMLVFCFHVAQQYLHFFLLKVSIFINFHNKVFFQLPLCVRNKYKLQYFPNYQVYCTNLFAHHSPCLAMLKALNFWAFFFVF